MPRRLAAAVSMLAFAVCLIAGIEAGNPPATTLSRALVAMAGTLVVGLIVGAMAQKMIDEDVARRQKSADAGAAKTSEKVAETEIPQSKSAPKGR